MLSSRVIKPERWQFGGRLLVGYSVSGDSVARLETIDRNDSASAAWSDEVMPEAPVLAEARRQADELLADAQARAEALIDQAMAGAEQLAVESRRMGFEEGHAAGLATARREVEAELAEERRAVEAELAAARAERYAQLADLQGDIAELALNIAGRILRRRVEEEPEVVLAIVGDALSRARNGERLRLRANPRDIPLIEEREQHLIASVQGLKELELVGDPGVPPGGCVVESGHGFIDARLDRQLELVGDALRAAVGYGR